MVPSRAFWPLGCRSVTRESGRRAGTHPGLRPPLLGRVMRIAASADEEGGEGQRGPVEEVVEPVAEINGGELGR